MRNEFLFYQKIQCNRCRDSEGKPDDNDLTEFYKGLTRKAHTFAQAYKFKNQDSHQCAYGINKDTFPFQYRRNIFFQGNIS